MLLRVLRTYLRPYRRLLAIVVALQAAQTAAGLVLPRLNAQIIDRGVSTGDTGFIWRRGLLMVLVSAIQVGFAVAAVYVGSRAAAHFGRDTRAALFHRVTEFSTQEVATFGAPSLITRITNDVQQVQILVQMTCALLIAAPITATGGVIMALREDRALTWIPAVAIPVLLLSVGNVIRKMIPTFRRVQDNTDRMNKTLREQIVGIRVVRAFVRERYEADRFAIDNDAVTATALRGGRYMALMFPTVIAIVNVSSVALVWFGADRVSRGQTSIGSLIALLTYLTMILMAVMMATFMGALVPRASVSAERIVAVLDTESSIRASREARAVLPRIHQLELRSVGFRYPGAEHPVLSNVSFRCSAGETVAIIGSTGSGKTTLINVLARLIDVTDGQILVNGIDIRDIAPHALWEQLGLVPQRPYLFGGSIATNLRIGKTDATKQQMWDALALAQAADFVRELPTGLDAAVAQGGTNLSGGQRQRVAIARALVRRPALLLFDDSFSALDLATDARLRDALAPHLTDTITIVVAQRISSIVAADTIVVLDNGSPVGVGTHDELVANCPTYVEIIQSQLTAEEAMR